jgi:phosphoketolase
MNRGGNQTVVFAVTGDMALLPVFEARDTLEAAGPKVRIVSAANPRRLYRPTDVAWGTVIRAGQRLHGRRRVSTRCSTPMC